MNLLNVHMDFYTVVLEEIGDLIQVVEMADDFGMQTGPCYTAGPTAREYIRDVQPCSKIRQIPCYSLALTQVNMVSISTDLSKNYILQ